MPRVQAVTYLIRQGSQRRLVTKGPAVTVRTAPPW